MSKAFPQIIVYSTPDCPYCYLVKKFLSEHGIKFKDIDVSQNQQALKKMITKSGQEKVPVIEINKQIIIGFDKEKISKILKLKD